MPSRVRNTLIITVVMTLAALPGCKKRPERGSEGAAAQAQKAPPPAALLGYVGLRNPGQTIDAGLALVQQFFPLPFTRDSLLDLMGQNLQMPRDLISAVDLSGTFWLLGLDDKVVGGADPGVAVLPIRSKKEFIEALEKRMKQTGKEGPLTVYEPKPGQLGLKRSALLVEDRQVFFPSSLKAYEACADYLRSSLLQQKLAHDVELRLLVEQIARVSGDEIDKGLTKAVQGVRENLNRKGSKALDPTAVADATDRTMKRYLEWFKSTREAVVGLDITRDKLTLTVHGQAKADGALARVIKRQRTGAPLGADRLPASSWLVFSDHGNPEAVEENRKTWRPTLQTLLTEMPPESREALTAAMEALGATTTGDYTMALHRAPGGAGLTLSVVSGVTDGDKAHAALKDLVKAGGKWVELEARKKGKEIPEGLVLAQGAFAHAGAAGTLFRLKMPVPPGKETEKQMAESLVGLPLTLGWAFKGKESYFTLGKDAEQQLKLLVEGKSAEQLLRARPSFGPALARSAGQVGLIYLSLTDLARWFSGTEVEKLAPPALLSGMAEVKSAPLFTWGVNEARDQLDLTLQLPAEHFVAFKPLVEALLRMRGLGGPPAELPPPSSGSTF